MLSDLDLFAFGDITDLPVDESAETWTSGDGSGITWFNGMGRYGDVLADVKIGTIDNLERVLHPFLGDAKPEFCGISHIGEDFICRLTVSLPTKDEQFFNHVKDMIYGSSYGRALARSKTHAECRSWTSLDRSRPVTPRARASRRPWSPPRGPTSL